jgi:hypothetical protein
MVSGFDVITRTVENGNESVIVSATYSADIYTASGGLPLAFVGQLSLLGTANFTYFGRDPGVNPLGTFVTELTDFSFEGTLNGNTFEVKKDPARVTTGTTTILPVSEIPPISYSVSGSLNIAALYSFNESPFLPAPPRPADLSPIPEPASGLLAGSVLLGIIGIASRRRRSS